MPLEDRDLPGSHALTPKHIHMWKNQIRVIKAGYSFVSIWPCMYCCTSIDYSGGKQVFRCENEQFVGRSRVQVTCHYHVAP
ncbi:hypothetical protein T440DRAFT_400093 [Plenodomus tracheiphilus IPT5]|uniref:Uncharacterized protein n=1 Tax=Plenodomus tracheiphilus IPT5 TaxID=1408161 RepID=A0A6A7B2X5_9PLEO|nr:hypothetical protein T440DRAFT_400093 [Plenodomus tracheiphilus IPT5]